MKDDYKEPSHVLAGQADDEDEPPIDCRISTVNQAHHGLRLDKYLAQWLAEYSRSYLQTLIESGHVRVDDEVQATSSRRLSVFQQVCVELFPTEQSLSFRPEAMPLSIVFEDDDLIVLNKPAGLVVHPASGNWSGTLLNGLLAHHAGAQALARAGIVHRLDKDTSGLMVVGKSQRAMATLVRAIAAREVQRQYVAIAHGAMPLARMEIDAPVGRDPRSRVRMAVVSGGKPARTDVDRLVLADRFTGVRCTLHTGRTHQIRVHMGSKGLPLVGDSVYGGRPSLGLTRQALHAERLALAHPVTGQRLSWVAVPPEDFCRAWREIDPSGELWA